MTYQNKLLRYYENKFNVDDLLKEAEKAPKSFATVGTIEKDGLYVPLKNLSYCTASIVDDLAFKNLSNELIEKCTKIVENEYNVECTNYHLDFLNFKNGTYYWPHIDGQYMDGDMAKRMMLNRDISCIVYLNDDYEGGEIYFKFLDTEIKPKKNSLLMFPCNWEYFHGVHKVKGDRYSFVVWFTTKPTMFEDEVIEDAQILHFLNQYKS
jgi:hypothetical protein